MIFDRIPVDATASPTFNEVSDNTCTRISIGEVFPPYEGDWAGSTGDLADLQPVDGIPDTLNLPFAKVATMYDAGTAKFTGLIEVGDLLQLSDHSQIFSITGITANSATAIVSVAFANPPKNVPTTDALWFGNTTDIKFRMYRRPTKSMTGAVNLPRGMCIDLSESGLGNSGHQFIAAMRSGTTFDDLYGPLHLIFNARGCVEGAYYIKHDSTGYNMVDLTSPGVYHLLIGRTDQVAPAAIASSGRDDFKANLYDERNFWLSINPYNGTISSTANLPVTPAFPLDRDADRAAARAFATSTLSTEGT